MSDVDTSAASADMSCAAVTTSTDTSAFECSIDTSSAHNTSTNDDNCINHHHQHHSSSPVVSTHHMNDVIDNHDSIITHYNSSLSKSQGGRQVFQNFNMGARGPNNLLHKKQQQQKLTCGILSVVVATVALAIGIVIFLVFFF